MVLSPSEKKEDAERALSEMNGEWLGNRAIRCNWANQKVTSTSTDIAHNNDYGLVLAAASSANTTVYIGNLTPDVTDTLLRSIFDEYGQIEEVRMQKEKGYAFIKYNTHDEAARAIVSVHNHMIGPKAVKCAWGKERTNSGTVVTPTAAPISVYPVRPPMVAPTPLGHPTLSGVSGTGPVAGQGVGGGGSGNGNGNGSYAPYPPMVATYNMYNPQPYNSPQYYNPHMNPQANPVSPTGMYAPISYQYSQPYYSYDSVFPEQGLPNN